ncbi:hypothetical protein PQ459_02820 [Chryseobacterium sp. KACC 21268]|nr:hypothetical protein PQ459_02820 [Chryseobacterium sp. KACC 21268]
MDTTNSILHPLDFFRTLDDKESFNDLKRQSVIECCDSYSNLVKGFSFEKGTVEIDYYDLESKGFQLFYYSFYEEIPNLIDSKIRQIKNIIDEQVSLFLTENKDLQIFFKNLETVVVALGNKNYNMIPNREEVITALSDILNYTEDKYGYTPNHKLLNKPFTINIEAYNSNSCRWLTVSSDRGELKLKKLYSLLSEEPKIIDCSEREFVNAFTQSKVTEGINWCIMGKNGQYSKQSLIQFVEALMSDKHIESKLEMSFNSSIEYVFRDNKGQKIKHISVSKSASTKRPTEWNRIQEILDKLE